MSNSASRLTIYGHISAIEQDIRNILIKYSAGDIPINKVIDRDTFDRAFERFQKDNGDSSFVTNVKEILPYVDFGDAVQLVMHNKNLLASNAAEEFRLLTPLLSSLVAIRNRVMHSRPLEIDDLTRTLDAAESCLNNKELQWDELRRLRTSIAANHSYVFGISIPIERRYEMPHNLPIPDFDETGYLGRTDDEKSLNKLIEGPYPVISVVGEGGLGKTGLVLKVAYSILDRKPPRFDTIIWCTAKANTVGNREIIAIRDAITTSFGLFRAIEKELSPATSPDPVAEIVSYLKEFKVLLIMDNLETVKDAGVEDFLDQLPSGSKVVITSRVGLGQFERRLNLRPLDESDSIRLMRVLVRARDIEALQGIDEGGFRSYARALKNNPGFIKWFISGVQSGLRPVDVLNNSAIFLDFCMENIYKYLSFNSKSVVTCIQCAQVELSQAELRHLTKLPPIALQEALNQLMSTNILRLSMLGRTFGGEIRYSLGEIAREYFSVKTPPAPGVYKSIRAQINSLTTEEQGLALGNGRYRYAFESIEARTKAEILIARELQKSLLYSGEHRYSESLELIDESRLLEPGYFEVHRVAAVVNCAAGKYSTADDCYARAVELNPKSSALRYWYGAFLARYALDPERALIQLREAEKLDSREPVIKIEMARVLMHRGEYAQARMVVEPILGLALHAVSLKKAWDLELQICNREALGVFEAGDTTKAIEFLAAAVQRVMDVPFGAFDWGVLTTIAKIVKLIERVERACDDPTRKLLMLQWHSTIVNVLMEHSFEYRSDFSPSALSGLVRRMLNGSKGMFGYILAEDGVEYYFNARNARGQIASVEALIDQEVLFELGENYEGVCAVNVRLKSSGGVR